MYGPITSCAVAVSLASALALAPLAGLPDVVWTTADEAYAQLAASLVPRVTEGLKRPGVLTVGIRRSAGAPFASVANGAPSGLDVEVGAAIANEMGLPVTYRYVDDVTDALSRSCDCVMEVAPEEAANFEVGCAYASSAVGLFGRGEPAIAHGGDLNGKVIAVQEGSASEAALDATALTCEKHTVPTIRDAFDALAAGKADYVLGNFVSCAYVASTLPDVSFLGTITEATDVGVAVPGGTDPVSAEVHAAFERISQNGILKECRRRWVGEVGPLGPDTRVLDVPMLAVAPEPEVVGNVDGDGTGAGSNAVSVYSMYYRY